MSENPTCEAVATIDVEDPTGVAIGQTSRPCKHEAKYEITRRMTGVKQLLCGVHARAYVVGRKAEYADVRPLAQPASA